MATNISQLIVGNSKLLDNYIIEYFELSKLAEEFISIEQSLNKLSVKRNILYIAQAAEKEKLTIEKIEPVFEFAQKRPHLGLDSNIVIEKAHLLKSEAQKKLLKLLKKPPHYLQIILLSE